MPFANAPADAVDPEIFAAVLTPHRSLSPRGVRLVLIALAVLSLAIGTTFFLLGAWLVPGFLGLDVAAVYVAFRLSRRSVRSREEIVVRRGSLMVRRVAADGAATVAEMNPYWARLEVDREETFGITAMAIVSRGERLRIGGFLGAAEREALAAALSDALAKARAVASP